jgi:putative protease
MHGERVQLEHRGGKKGDRVYKTYDSVLMKTLEKTYSGPEPLRKIPVDFRIVIREGEPVDFRIYDNNGNTACIKGPVPEKAIKIPLTDGKVRDQVSKLGSTPYSAGEFDIELDGGLSLSAGEINSLRRDAIKELSLMRLQSQKHTEVSYNDTVKIADSILVKEKKDKRKLRVSVFLNDSSCVDSAIDAGADMIIFGGDRLRGPDFDSESAIQKCVDRGTDIYLASPRIVRNEFDEIIKEMERGMNLGAKGIYADNMGIFNAALKRGIVCSSGFSLNIFNSITISLLNSLGGKFISLSPELSLKEIRLIAPYVENCEALCYGRIEMMVSEYCPIGAVHGCAGRDRKLLCESRDITIKDKMGMVFPVKTDIYCRSHIYNSKVLNVLEDLSDIVSSGIDILRLNLNFEDKGHVYSIVKAFKDYALLLEKGIDAIPESARAVLEYTKDIGLTKGHYYRGTL